MQAFYNHLADRTFPDTEKRIKDRVYKKIGDLSMEIYKTKEPVPFYGIANAPFQKIEVGENWGELFDCAWFHFTGDIPSAALGKAVCIIDISGEGCVYTKSGVPVQGITSGTSTFSVALGSAVKRIIPLSDKLIVDGKIDFFVDAGNNDLFGKFQKGIVLQAEIAVCDEKMRSLYYDFHVLHSLYKNLEKDSPRAAELFYALSKADRKLIYFSEKEIRECSEILKDELSKKNGYSPFELYATGHAHLDLAWLWPIRETKRKAVRTFSTAVALCDRYPDYVFAASQPQQYQWVKEAEPMLFQRIKEKVKSGQIEPIGAMWVEPDMNISSGESIVRQLIYGKQFFREEFGIDTTTLWLPDVFGFNAALPQILRKAGVKTMLTIKLSWNEHNSFPHHTFMWEGIDGSKVLVHMPPEGTYNSCASPESAMIAQKKFTEKGKVRRAMMVFGVGDGGGGPSTSHIERLARMKNLCGMPPVHVGKAQAYFDELWGKRKDLKVYRGELYLEKHQGTYTTQAKNKFYNRKMEVLLRETEFLCTIAMLNTDFHYPKKELDEIWKEILLYQFHDILPGSSIRRVYDESIARYQSMKEKLKELMAQAAKALGNGANSYLNASPAENYVTIEKEGKKFLLTLPAYSVRGMESARELDKKGVKETRDRLENPFIKVLFDSNGSICGVIDKRKQTQILKEGNRFVLYEDAGDAWDFDDRYYERVADSAVLQEMKIECDGQSAIRTQTLKIGSSIIRQVIKIDNMSAMVRFDNHVVWQEEGKMLRCNWRHSVRTNVVDCDIQFGNVQRSVTENNLLEYAQKEICAHKWISVKSGNKAFSLINDCKYGYRVKDDGISMNILRATKYPGTDADRGEHDFSFGIYVPGIKDDTQKISYAFNQNIVPVNCPPTTFVSVSDSSVILETIKRAEESDDVILRLYESERMSEEISLTFDRKFKKIIETDLLENEIREVAKDADSVKLAFSEFEIKTLKLVP